MLSKQKKQKSKKKDKDKGILTVKHLYKRFGRKNVLQNITFTVDKGDIFGIVGVSGAGKTVLLKTIVNFFRPNKGKILYKDKPLTGRRARKVVGFSVQDSSIYPELTVQENITHFGRLYGMNNRKIKRRTKKLLKLLELKGSERKFGAQLSGGMQKRLDIACALIHNPELLLLDEPITGLDVLLKIEVLRLIRSINKKGVTVIVVSLPLDIEPICNKLVLINDGKLIKKGLYNKLRVLYRDHPLVILKKFKRSIKK